MFERVAKRVKTDSVRSWRLNQLARSIFLTEFISAFFLAMRYSVSYTHLTLPTNREV